MLKCGPGKFSSESIEVVKEFSRFLLANFSSKTTVSSCKIFYAHRSHFKKYYEGYARTPWDNNLIIPWLKCCDGILDSLE